MRGGQHPLRRNQAAAAELRLQLRLRAVVETLGKQQRHLERPRTLLGFLAAEDAVAAVFACLLPVRKAVRVNPLEALRAE